MTSRISLDVAKYAITLMPLPSLYGFVPQRSSIAVVANDTQAETVLLQSAKGVVVRAQDRCEDVV